MRARVMQKETVYFISSGDGPIKIGRAVDVKKRLSGLQTGSPEKLQVLGVMNAVEVEIHRKFEAYRKQGEWFERTAELLNFIYENRDLSLWPDPAPITTFGKSHEQLPYGPVQADENFDFKYGYYDDDDSEITKKCAFCAEADRRGVENLVECDECHIETFAVVFFGAWGEGHTLVPHEFLRPLDREIEKGKCLEIIQRLHPKIDEKGAKLVYETDDPAAPFY